ncbi:adenine phosphoribosyltransferase [Ruania halotolerans]|uniref:adenine phosphoribosyltransferase n=1 Tax=Ruania halotolerans TaxID=2897773 RepID=UPI001E4C18F5|nr:adenine phosphoribosyltransferase [Ruania halotolerans]UFU04761.1 adenine phosphoribosyltransferase [Ruania halotolerans]
MSPLPVPPGLEELVRARVRSVPDYPEAGIVFRDITPLLADGTAFSAVIGHLADTFGGEVDTVAGVEARGFLLAAPLAAVLGCSLVAVRKAGKLPPPVLRADYELEYASASIELSEGAVRPGARVAVLDDVLATGGTAAATCGLLERAGATVTGLGFLIELVALHGREQLPGRVVHPLVTY